MKKLITNILILFVLSSSIGVCDEQSHTKSRASHKKGHTQHAPRRLKTKPIESEDAWTATLESNIYQGTVYLNPYIGYSGFNGWDISISSYNIPTHGGGAQNFEYDTYIGISKTFSVLEDTDIMIGSQNGTTLFSNPGRRWHSMSFANIRQDITDNIMVYVGPYYANAALTTAGNQVGVMTGTELKVIPNKFHITGDYISGHQSVSGGIINLQYFPHPKVQLYVGIIIPEKNSGNEFAGIVGFSLNTKEF